MIFRRYAAMIATTLLLAAVSAFAVDGTLSGRVSSDALGSPAIAGATIRTEGEPTYSAASASDGSYTLTAPPSNHNILVSAAGATPQRVSATITSGSTTNADFALRPASTDGMMVSLPAPLDWGEPASAPTPPGDNFPVSFADMAAAPVAGAPQISGWNETVKPDESFTLTGARFTTRTGADIGTDSVVWIWARTSASGGVLRQAKTWRITENTLTATLPDDIPFGMVLVWVENSNGPSAPICINKTTSHWVGPLGNTVQAGNAKRIFGRNISYGHGTSQSFVYIQPASGGSFISCPVNTVNPYMVEFTVPLGTADGNYKAFVHNGHGGVYGWSDGMDIVVQPDWVRGNNEVALSPSGGDDTSSIQNAINSMSALPNGGSVRLSAGTFKTYDTVTLKGKVRLVGAGMDLTTIALRMNTQRDGYFYLSENNVTLEGLTLNACLSQSNAQAGSGIITGSGADSFKMIDTRVTTEAGIYCFANYWGSTRTEMSGCEFYRAVGAGYSDGWVHDCNLYGGPYGIYPPATTGYVGETEAAYNMSTRAVFEYSHIETKDWPVNTNGSMNYTTFLSFSQYAYKPWAKRVALAGNGRMVDNYMANLTTKDVAVEDNRGEMFLFHGMGAAWFGNALSINGLAITVRTDGTVNGQVVSLNNYYPGTNPSPLVGGRTVPNADVIWNWMSTDNSFAVIIGGKGIGQARMVVSHTSNSLTVDKPWRIQPDSTSVILVTPLYKDNVVYNNVLNAFPVGYAYLPDNQMALASTGVDLDGNSWNVAAEGNTSRRTRSSRQIAANSGGPTYWCTMRGDSALDVHEGELGMVYWENNPTGPTLLGNSYRGCSVSILDSATGGAVRGLGEGTVIENSSTSAKMGYNLTGAAKSGSWSDGFVLYRNGSVIATDPGTASTPVVPEPVYISSADGKQFLVNNSYTGGSQTYYLGTSVLAYSIPAPVYRFVKLSGYVGRPVPPVLVPVANAGIQSMTWTATTIDSWIAPSIQANGSLGAESTYGRLKVSVDTTGMAAGKHWGSVTISNGLTSVKVGVCVDLASGTPSNAAPVASFTATPTAGTAPLAVNFNASASYDSDGSIVSYAWEFGDGAYGTGVTTSHTYAGANTYTPVLTVTDNSGAVGTTWTNVLSAPVPTSVSLSGTPNGIIGVNTPVTLTASAVGGYQVQYKFLLKTDAGWNTLRDYSSSNTCVWTPAVSGYYELKVYARNSVSSASYDVAGNSISYPVGLLPTGMKIWLKADAGITKDGSGLVSTWADQSGSGNNLVQTTGTRKPTAVDSAANGRPVVRFTGPSQYLQAGAQVLSGNTAFTAFTVARINQIPSSTPYQYFWWNGAASINGGYGCYLSSTGRLSSGWGYYSGEVADTTSVTVGSLYRICSVFNGTNGGGPHYLWINGNSVASFGKSGSNLTGGTFTVGNYLQPAGNGLYGDLAEILIYDRALTDTERANVDGYLQSRWAAQSPRVVDRLKDVRSLGDGVLVSITSPKVATVASGVYSDGGIYVCESDRTCGMKVLNAGTVNLWDNLTLTGTTDTDTTTGERILRVTSVSRVPGSELVTLGMNNSACVPNGQLVRIWGKVKDKTSAYITVDDGTGSPVRAEIDGLVTTIATTPNIGDYVSVTGPAGYMAGGTAAVRVRSGSDIEVY